MKSIQAFSATVCLALMGVAFSPSVIASDWDRKTTITFNKPVQIPAVHQTGMGVLPPGTYVFKVVALLHDRHVVQIFNKDETKIYASILAIPNERLHATADTVITFRERPAGQPQALLAWFYPGRLWGEEFVYPKAVAAELAKESAKPVLDMPASVKEEAVRPEEPQVIAELERTPVTAVEPSGKPVELAQVVTPPPPAETQIAQALPPKAPEPVELPKTGSPLPLVALFGLLAMGGALSLRYGVTR